jgi:hypothetical protein
MRWLVHGTLAPAVAEALARHGHLAQTLTEGQIATDAAPIELLKAAHAKQLDVITNDAALASAAIEQPVKFDRSLVYLQLEGGELEQDDAIDRLFKRYKRLTPGRLYTVTASRVKVRQLPGSR